MSDILVRQATHSDLPAIQAIYAHHVRTGTGSFETDPPDLEEMLRRFDKVRALGWPWLVATDPQQQVLGYAYAGPFRERAAYRATVENSVYVAPGAEGRGVGRALMAALIGQCRAAGAMQMLAVIGDSDNAASIGLHKAMGFADVGVLRRVGVKFGRTLDVVLLQLDLSA